MKRPEILLSYKHKQQLEKEFGITAQAIRMALLYVYNSDRSKAVRHRAKELLQQEAAKIED